MQDTFINELCISSQWDFDLPYDLLVSLETVSTATMEKIYSGRVGPSLSCLGGGISCTT